MENWQKRKIDRSLKYQTRVFSEHINELVAVKRDGKVITLDDGRKMVEFVSCSVSYTHLTLPTICSV